VASPRKLAVPMADRLKPKGVQTIRRQTGANLVHWERPRAYERAHPASAVAPIRRMMVTYKAANENDWFQPEEVMSKSCWQPLRGARSVVLTFPACPTAVIT